jgi:hypothetical protein
MGRSPPRCHQCHPPAAPLRHLQRLHRPQPVTSISSILTSGNISFTSTFESPRPKKNGEDLVPAFGTKTSTAWFSSGTAPGDRGAVKPFKILRGQDSCAVNRVCVRGKAEGWPGGQPGGKGRGGGGQQLLVDNQSWNAFQAVHQCRRMGDWKSAKAALAAAAAAPDY